MTITKRQIATWIEEESRRVDPARDRDDLDREFILRVLQKPVLAEQLAKERLDHLVWNLAWAIAFAPREDSWAVQAAKAAAEFLASRFAETTTYPDALSMFWEVAIGTPLRRDAAFHEAVFEALGAQLATGNPWVQASALHGFGHLRDPRCRPVIRDFLRSCIDPRLADYARDAMAFDVL